jgi:hypothetical protein
MIKYTYINYNWIIIIIGFVLKQNDMFSNMMGMGIIWRKDEWWNNRAKCSTSNGLQNG